MRRVGVEFIHADGRTDGRTDMTNLIAAFRVFVKALINEKSRGLYWSPSIVRNMTQGICKCVKDGEKCIESFCE
jgi:hypothetical protein